MQLDAGRLRPSLAYRPFVVGDSPAWALGANRRRSAGARFARRAVSAATYYLLPTTYCWAPEVPPC